jgi:hypothetical protein
MIHTLVIQINCSLKMTRKMCSATTDGAQFKVFERYLNAADSTVRHGKYRNVGRCPEICEELQPQLDSL